MTVGLSRAHNAQPVFTFTKSGADWGTAGSGDYAHLTTGMTGESRVTLNAANNVSERIAVYSNIEAPANSRRVRCVDF